MRRSLCASSNVIIRHEKSYEQDYIFGDHAGAYLPLAAGVYARRGALAASSVLLGACAATGPTADIPDDLQVSADSDELGDALTSYAAITTYNNYYEFSTDKEKELRGQPPPADQ